MANASFEEIVLDRPLQQIVIHGRLADFLVLLDRLVIVAFEGGQVGDLEEVFVCKPGFWRLRRGRKKKSVKRITYDVALSLSYHSAVFSYASSAFFAFPISTSYTSPKFC